jgi:hypothetical protein
LAGFFCGVVFSGLGRFGADGTLDGILIAVLVGIGLMSFLWNLTPKSAEARLQAAGR